MTENLAIRVRTAFGLAFDIEKTAERRSGFKPAIVDLGAGKELFGELRLKGFAAAIESGFTEKLIVVGGLEGRYPREDIGRADAIRLMLIEDHGISPEGVDARQSAPNTGGNIDTIKAAIHAEDLVASECALLTNHYHLPRTQMDLRASKLALQTVSAEALWLLKAGSPAERVKLKSELISCFGGGPLAERIVEEINGISDKLVGFYVSRGGSNRIENR